MAFWMIGATVSGVMPRSWQYLVFSHSDSVFCPLLALHPQQQRVMFSLVMMLASLIMCSQLGVDFRDTLMEVNSFLQ